VHSKLRACVEILKSKSWQVQADGFYMASVKNWQFDDFVKMLRNNIVNSVVKREDQRDA